MKTYTDNLNWAVVTIIDRSTQDDHKSKLQLAGTFSKSHRRRGLFSSVPAQQGNQAVFTAYRRPGKV